MDASITLTFWTALLTLTAAAFTAWRTAINGKQLSEIHVVVNSRTDEMMRDIARLQTIISRQSLALNKAPPDIQSSQAEGKA